MQIKILSQTMLLSATALMLASCASKNSPTINVKSGELVLYPDPNEVVVQPKEEIVFKFVPKSKEIDVQTLKIDFDGTTRNIATCKDTKIVGCVGQTLNALHSYNSEGSYQARIQSSEGTTLAERTIVIPPSYISDEELQYEAIKKIAKGLEKGIREVAFSQPNAKFSFSSLKDANFEYKTDKKDVKVIYKLMQALIENKRIGSSSYTILEREPQALVRLAHESLWTEDPSTNELKETKKLEYGLRTTYENSKKPMVYAIELSGVNDSRSAITKATGDKVDSTNREATKKENRKKEKIKESISEDKIKQDSEAKSIQKASQSQRPLLFARFDTADFLVVIDRVLDSPVKRSKPVYFDKKYNSLAIKRTAKFKVNARILDRNGRIHWIKDLSGEESDLVLPQFAPPVQKASAGNANNEKSRAISLNPFSYFFEDKDKD